VIRQNEINISTEGRGTYDLTARVQSAVQESGIEAGMCSVFIHHTAVMRDLETFMSALAPDGDPAHTHTAEGPDDMPSHIRSVLTHADLNLPVRNGRCDLGTWQGVYLWEHRHAAHQRKVTVTISG
jgi:secondary thiamine-phosphate synthase enzyme